MPDLGPPDSEEFPLLSEVYRRWQAREPIPAEIFYSLSDEARARAFTAIRLWDEHAVQAAAVSIKKGLEEGLSQSEWRERFWKDIAARYGGGADDSGYVATVFRTNVQAGYAAGRYGEMFSDLQMELDPYVMYDAIGDDRTRPEHRALDGKVFRKDDMDARRYFPPIGFNCRCSLIPMSDEDVANGGYEVTPGGLIPSLPKLDADGNPILGKDGRPALMGSPPKGWDTDRVKALVPDALRDGRLEEPAGGGRRRGRVEVPEATGPGSPVPPLPPKLEQKLVELEGKSIDLEDHEHGVVVSQDGTVLWEKDGPKYYPPRRTDTPEESDWKRKHSEADGFMLPISQTDAKRMADAILTHNHPSGHPLSPADILFAVGANLVRVRAVANTPEGPIVFEADRGGGWPAPAYAEQVSRAVQAALEVEWRGRFDSVKHLDDEAAEERLARLWDEFSHELLDRISKALNIPYGRRPWSP